LYLAGDASRSIGKLKGYERQQVEKTLMQLSGMPSPPDNIASRTRPAFYKAMTRAVGSTPVDGLFLLII
jgi:hypothetical protein